MQTALKILTPLALGSAIAASFTSQLNDGNAQSKDPNSITWNGVTYKKVSSSTGEFSIARGIEWVSDQSLGIFSRSISNGLIEDRTDLIRGGDLQSPLTFKHSAIPLRNSKSATPLEANLMYQDTMVVRGNIVFILSRSPTISVEGDHSPSKNIDNQDKPADVSKAYLHVFDLQSKTWIARTPSPIESSRIFICGDSSEWSVWSLSSDTKTLSRILGSAAQAFVRIPDSSSFDFILHKGGGSTKLVSSESADASVIKFQSGQDGLSCQWTSLNLRNGSFAFPDESLTTRPPVSSLWNANKTLFTSLDRGKSSLFQVLVASDGIKIAQFSRGIEDEKPPTVSIHTFK